MTCTNVDEVHINDIGTIFRMTLLDEDDNPVDLATTTQKQLIFKKPSGATLTKTAVFYTDGTDGIIQYTVVDGDLDELGEWKWQAYIVNPVGSWRSNIAKFRVYKNL
jgi:hypothetical protein